MLASRLVEKIIGSFIHSWRRYVRVRTIQASHVLPVLPKITRKRHRRGVEQECLD
jgi:hypothetical protein